MLVFSPQGIVITLKRYVRNSGKKQLYKKGILFFVNPFLRVGFGRETETKVSLHLHYHSSVVP